MGKQGRLMNMDSLQKFYMKSGWHFYLLSVVVSLVGATMGNLFVVLIGLSLFFIHACIGFVLAVREMTLFLDNVRGMVENYVS